MIPVVVLLEQCILSVSDTVQLKRCDESDFSQKNDNVLILNKKINEDGTVKILNKTVDLNEINKLIDKKLSEILEKKMNNMLETQLPIILDNYFKNKKQYEFSKIF